MQPRASERIQLFLWGEGRGRGWCDQAIQGEEGRDGELGVFWGGEGSDTWFAQRKSLFCYNTSIIVCTKIDYSIYRIPIIPDPDGQFDFTVDSPQNTKDKILYIIHGIIIRNIIDEQSLRQYIQSLFLQTYNSIVSIKCIYLINGILWNGGISH